MAETQQGADNYPLYRRSSPDSSGHVSAISMMIGGSKVNQEIDKRWIVPYNKLSLQSMNCHCNVELCMSIKSIKYVCMWMFPSITHGATSLEAEENKAQAWLAFQVSRKHTFLVGFTPSIHVRENASTFLIAFASCQRTTVFHSVENCGR